MEYKESDLFERLVDLNTQVLTIREDIKALRGDYRFDPEDNPKGLDKEVVKLVSKAATLHAKRNFFEVKEDALAVFDKYVELVGEEG